MAENKAALIREMLKDGMSPKEIKSELKDNGIEVTSQYVYNVKRSWAAKSKKSEKGDEDDEDEDDDTEDEDDEDYFTRVPKEKQKNRNTEGYECGACGASWTASSRKHQNICPSCGVEFE